MGHQELSSEYTQDVSHLRTTVAVLERDVVQQLRITDKLSEAVEKIQEMNANLCRMISLHELKHDGAEKVQQEIDTDLKEITKRVDMINDTKMAIKSQQLLDLEKKQQETEKEIEELVKWKYIVTGAAIVLGYLLGFVNWQTILGLFKG